MIAKYRFGTPVVTDAAVLDIPCSEGKPSFGCVVSEEPFEWTYTMSPSDQVFGLGENMGGMNKRGRKYTSWCTDEPCQDEGKESIYGAHNFMVILGEENFALFFDTPSRIHFDIGWTDMNEIKVTSDGPGVFMYVVTLEGKAECGKANNLVKQFRQLIGQSYVPPKWAFGFQQSRWGYKTEEDIRRVVKGYRDAGIPLDMMCMDIDYMVDFEDFTVSKERYPDLKKMVQSLKDDGVRVVPIIDAGVKVKEGYFVYDEGIENDYFCKKADGKPYVAGVWPGRSHFPDFLRPEVRDWFGMKYKILTDMGVEGFWNDMNEPAMFYSDESLAEAHQKILDTDISNLDINTFFDYSYLSGSMKNSMDDYRRFYHVGTDADGNTVTYRHDQVHNMFGYMMTRSAGESLEKIFPGERKLLYSRASYIGAHRYGGIWTGDAMSWWSHLEQQIKMMSGLNMCGFLYTGSDIGGFGGSTTEDLLLRWTAFGVFTPLMRNHSALGNRNQEYYMYKSVNDFKSMVELRYALLPYIYSEFVKCVCNNTSYFRPVGFDFEDDPMARKIEDQLMVGEDLMIAPVYTQNATGRYVYMPEDMMQVTWIKGKAEQHPVEKGIHWIEIPLESVVFFVRKGHAVPMCKSSISTSSMGCEGCGMCDKYHGEFSFVGDGSSYFMYQDDGVTRDIHLEGRLRELKAK